jgi:hypothetical protein
MQRGKEMIWPKCPIEGCNNRICLALKSDKCFVHTKGFRWFKLLRISCNNMFKRVGRNENTKT